VRPPQWDAAPLARTDAVARPAHALERKRVHERRQRLLKFPALPPINAWDARHAAVAIHPASQFVMLS